MTTNILTLKSLTPWLYYSLFGILGAIVGSFLNVCIYRLPRGESVIWPRSKCAHCGEVLRWFELIPLMSFIFLRGRCTRCGIKISHRYWIVELITAIAFMISASLPTGGEIIIGCLLSSILIGISGIDLEHFIIADEFIVWGGILGLVASTIFPIVYGITDAPIAQWVHVQGFFRSFLGMMIGSGLGLWLMFWGEKIFKKEAFGFGDVFLLGVIGTFCGWQGVFFSLFGGSVIAIFFLIPLMILERVFGVRIGPRKVLTTDNAAITPESAAFTTTQTTTHSTQHSECLLTPEATQPDKQDALQFGMAIPFGPWLALGAIVYFWFYRTELTLFFSNIAEVFLGKNV